MNLKNCDKMLVFFFPHKKFMKIVTKPVPSGHPLTFPFVYIQCEKGLCSLLSGAVTFYYFYCLHNLDEGSEKNLEFVMSYGFIEKLVKNPSC